MDKKQIVGGAAKFFMAVVVMIFLGIHSLNFFEIGFPEGQWFYSYLGFAMTGGGVIGYLIILKTSAKTDLEKIVSVIMLLVCLAGEIVTATFGMQIGAANNGYVLAQGDYDFMFFAIKILAAFHGLALIAYVVGDEVAALFLDLKDDGKINGSVKRPQIHSYAAESKGMDFTQGDGD